MKISNIHEAKSQLSKLIESVLIVFISAASAWEIAIKKSLGKLQIPDDLKQQLEKQNFTPLAIDIDNALTWRGDNSS